MGRAWYRIKPAARLIAVFAFLNRRIGGHAIPRRPISAFSAGVIVAASLAGCSPWVDLLTDRSAALYQEIQAMTADRSSTSDSDCGVAILHGCIYEQTSLVYSRATVDEALLLEKVEEYNQLQDLLNDGNPYCGFESSLVAAGAISVNGVCVAGTR